ncbi:MAG: PAS domain S-box protein [Desulfobacteraceae bacterium]|nr:PAS domain S-box protein [Desulfobacteraceae bacterium]
MDQFQHKTIVSYFKRDDQFQKEYVDYADFEMLTRSKSNIFSYPVLLALFLFVTPFYTDFPGVALYSCIIVLILTASRYFSIVLYKKLYPQKRRLWQIIFYSSIYLSGILVGIFGGIVLYLYGLNWTSLFYLLLASGITSGASNAFSYRPFLTWGYLPCVMLPGIIWGFSQGKPDTIPIAISISIYLATMMIVGKVLYHRILNSFAKGYALKIQAKELEKAKNEMELRVHERTAELKQANKILLESEQRYNALFSGINDAVLVHYLPKKNQTESFIETNEVACTLLHYSKHKLQLMNLHDINTPESPTDTGQILKKLKTQQNMLFEQIWLTGLGQRISVEVHARRFDFKGRQAILYTVRNITERKKMQEMMIQTEKIMSVGGLAAGMAHEINNPLAGILQTSQVVKNRLTKRIPANIAAAEALGLEFHKIRSYLEHRETFRMIDSIIGAAKRASEIVQNMLSFARKSSTQFHPENMSELMEKTLEIAKSDYNLKKKFDFKNIKIQKDYEKNLSPVCCKATEIQQVFFNILTNGTQAMMSMGKPIEPSFIIKISGQDDMVQIEIQDNGPGMSREIRQRVFEPFFTTKPPGKGTGLGLSVSHMIIKNNHNGNMEIQSEPDNGTNFIIRLPFKNKRGDTTGLN